VTTAPLETLEEDSARAEPTAPARQAIVAFRAVVSLLGVVIAVASVATMRREATSVYLAYFGLALLFQFIWLGSPFPFALPFYTTMNAFAYIAGPSVAALEYLQRVVSYPILARLADRGWITLPPPLEPVIGGPRKSPAECLRVWIDHGTTGTLGALGIVMRAELSRWLQTSMDLGIVPAIAITEYSTLVMLGLLHATLPLPVAVQLRRGGRWRWRLDDERVDLIVVVLLVAPLFVFVINLAYRFENLPGAIGFSLATLGPHALTKLSVDRLGRVTGLLETKQRELKELVETVAHDLKAPISSALLTVDDVLERDGTTLGAETREDLDRGIALLARAEGMVRDLSRTFQIVWEPEPWGAVDLNATLARAMETLGPKAAARGTQLWIGTLPVVWGQSDKLEHAFGNLLGNAIDHARSEGGHVTVDGDLANGMATICVRDDGCGIPPEYHRRIFELYARVPRPGARQGSGVGLAIVKRVVEAHGGAVWVESEPGAGSRFSVRLPVGGAPAVVPPETTRSA
jgi:signal transduction histidine kinase